MTTSTRPFDENASYCGTITKQVLRFGRDDVPELALYVQVTGQLADPKNPASGELKLAGGPITVETKLTFDEADDQKLSIAQETLEKLGFTSDDLEQLNPANKKHVSLVGKTCFVRPSYRTYNEKERTFWNIRFPKVFEDKPIASGHLKKSALAERYRDLMKRRAEEKAAKQVNGEPVPY